MIFHTCLLVPKSPKERLAYGRSHHCYTHIFIFHLAILQQINKMKHTQSFRKRVHPNPPHPTPPQHTHTCMTQMQHRFTVIFWTVACDRERKSRLFETWFSSVLLKGCIAAVAVQFDQVGGVVLSLKFEVFEDLSRETQHT